MRVAFLQSPGLIQFADVPVPQPRFGEVRVRLKQVGTCGSDVHLFEGHRLLDHPTIIGHEGLGFIDAIGAGVQGRSLGERVVIEPNIPCWQCRFCLSGRGNICLNKRTIGLTGPGCFAEYIVVPADFCWAVPNSIDDADAVTIEPTAVAVHALLASEAKPGDTIAVIGLGAIGLLLTHLALALGYRVLVTEINAAKVQLAVDLGAEAMCPPTSQSNVLAQEWAANEVCAVFECAGTSVTAMLAATAAPRGSAIVLVGLSEKAATFVPLKIAREGITIMPSIIYDHPIDFKRTLRLIESRTIQPGFIISRQCPLDNLQSALSMAAKGNDSKIVVTM